MQNPEFWLAPLALLPVLGLLIMACSGRLSAERTLPNSNGKTVVVLLRLILATYYSSVLFMLFALTLTGFFRLYQPELLFVAPFFTFVAMGFMLFACFLQIIEVLFVRK